MEVGEEDGGKGRDLGADSEAPEDGAGPGVQQQHLPPTARQQGLVRRRLGEGEVVEEMVVGKEEEVRWWM